VVVRVSGTGTSTKWSLERRGQDRGGRGERERTCREQFCRGPAKTGAVARLEAPPKIALSLDNVQILYDV
jgi:hypothetical protein